MTTPARPAAGPDRIRVARHDRRAVGIALAVVCGLGVAVQSRINGELGVRVHDGILAAAISFVTGTLVLAVLVPVLPRARRGTAGVYRALRTGKVRFWECLGGAFGGYLVITQGVTVGALGVAVFTVAVVAGQCCASLVVDRLGLGPAGPHPVTRARLIGAGLAVLAVLTAVSGRLGTPTALGLAVLPALAGLGTAWQQAVNGRVHAVAGSALSAAGVNFAVGTVVVLAAFAVDALVRGGSGSLPTAAWLYLGGPLGVVFIAIGAAIVRLTGVLLLGLSMVAGQLTGALALDVIVPQAGGRPGPLTLAGVALTLVAVVIAAR